jgi:hypothetical protein
LNQLNPATESNPGLNGSTQAENGLGIITEEVSVKTTSTQTGQNPQWSECFAFHLDVHQKSPIAGMSHDFELDSDDSDQESNNFYLLELGIWSTHMVVSDKLVGKAYLKFNSTEETGSITNWVNLKDDEQNDVGQIYVSITKEIM